MATCLKTRTELKKWLKDFQLTACNSYTGSLTFMKTSSAIALSMIAYNRKIFPERLFTVETYEGQKIQMLKSQSNCREANLFHSWIIGFQDALEKQYLRTIILSINGGAPESKILESYRFSFSYKENNMPSSNTLPSNIRDATMCLFKNAGDLNKFDTLPEKFEIRMELLYYDEVTPSDYEPPGYSASLDGYALQCASSQEPLYKCLIGSVFTSCHKMKMVSNIPMSKLKCLVDMNDLEMRSDDEIDEELRSTSSLPQGTSCRTLSTESNTEHFKNLGNLSASYDDPVSPDVSHQSINNLFDGDSLFTLQNVDADNHTNPAQSEKIIENKFKKLSLNKLIDGKVSVINEGGDVDVRCPCGKKFLGDTIQCRCCKTFQHSVCFGLLNNEESIVHYCDLCALKYPQFPCTDINLFGLDPESKKELCLFRNALVLCTLVRMTSLDNLIKNLQVSTKTAMDIMKEMEKSNLFHLSSIDPTDITQPRLINRTALSSSVLPHYFTNYQYARRESINPTRPDVDNNADDYLGLTPNVFSQKDMEDKDQSYDRNEHLTKASFNERRSKRLRKPVKRYTNEPVSATRAKIQRKSSTMDTINFM